MPRVRTAQRQSMTSRKAAVYGVGGALLVAYLAAANMPSQDVAARARAARPRHRRHRHRSPPKSARRPRGCRRAWRRRRFPTRIRAIRFRSVARRAPRARRRRDAHGPRRRRRARRAVLPPPLPALTLMGIAEETTAAGPRRTAVIGGDGDAIYHGDRRAAGRRPLQGHEDRRRRGRAGGRRHEGATAALALPLKSSARMLSTDESAFSGVARRTTSASRTAFDARTPSRPPSGHPPRPR